jgi:hypothetical protein
MPELEFNGVDGSSVYLKQWHLPNDGGTHVWQIDNRSIQMRKINFLTVAAALILAGVGTWAASTTHASVVAPRQIDPFQMMMSAPKNLPTQQEVDKRLEQMNLSGCDSACARAVQDYFTNS